MFLSLQLLHGLRVENCSQALVADPEGVQVGTPIESNYFIFMKILRKIWLNLCSNLSGLDLTPY